MLSLERWKSGLSCVCVERCKPGRRVQTWQKGANLAEPDRRVQTWQKGANLAEGCKPGRKVQTWQKGANLAERCKPGRRVQTWQKGAKGAKSGYPPCTFAPSGSQSRIFFRAACAAWRAGRPASLLIFS